MPGMQMRGRDHNAHVAMPNSHKPRMERDLQTALKNAGVGRRLRALMSYGLRTWAEGEVTNAKDHTEAEKNVFYDQGNIGWSHLLKGRISADGQW